MFIGASSRWSFAVRRVRRQGLHLTTPAGRPLCRCSEAEYAVAVWRGTQQLLAAGTLLDGAPLFDLRDAIAAFPAEFRR